MARPPGIPLSPEHKAKLMAAANAGRRGKPMPLKYSRSCESCQSDFLGKTSTQRWCYVCCPDKTFRARLHNYGVSKPMWDRMLVEQDGHCALCEKEPTVVDHDHVTKVVRGLLCHGCNIALNRYEVSDWVVKAAVYMTRGKN